MAYLCQKHSIQKNEQPKLFSTTFYYQVSRRKYYNRTLLHFKKESSLIIVMMELDSLLYTVELVVIINKNEYHEINN